MLHGCGHQIVVHFPLLARGRARRRARPTLRYSREASCVAVICSSVNLGPLHPAEQPPDLTKPRPTSPLSGAISELTGHSSRRRQIPPIPARYPPKPEQPHALGPTLREPSKTPGLPKSLEIAPNWPNCTCWYVKGRTGRRLTSFAQSRPRRALVWWPKCPPPNSSQCAAGSGSASPNRHKSIVIADKRHCQPAEEHGDPGRRTPSPPYSSLPQSSKLMSQ